MCFIKNFNKNNIDKTLMVLYENHENNSLIEFKKDIKSIKLLRKYIKRFIVSKEYSDFLILRNNFILLYNIFGWDGMDYIGKTYFNDLYSYYSTICFFEIEKNFELDYAFLFKIIYVSNRFYI